MKKMFKKMVIGLVVALGSIITPSCDNSFENHQNPNPVENETIQLVKNPDVVAWSGEQLLGSTFGTRSVNLPMSYATRSENDYPDFFNYCTTGNENDKGSWSYAWDNSTQKNYDLTQYYDKLPRANGRGRSDHATSQAEADYVFEWLENNSDKGYTEATTPDVYFFQCVGANDKKYNWNGNADETYTMNNLILNEDYTNPYNSEDHTFGNSYSGNSTSSVQGELVLCANYPIINPSYTHTNGGRMYDAYKFYYITLPEDINSEDAGKTCLYLGFDFRATDNIEPNRIPNGYAGNGKYYDWVMKIIPADGSVITSPSSETPEKPESTIPETPETPSENEYQHNNEVEVNLEILDSHDYTIADLVTKLSIHVRHVTDVDIIIPVPNKYVVESDDLYIFNEHYDGEYGGLGTEEPLLTNETTSISYEIAGQKVTLTIEFISNEDGGYIHIFTEGINEEVINYCFENYDDGINFEVYQYYQTEKVEDGEVISVTDLTREMLKGFLDGSTISFTDNPDYYINAFGWDYVDETNGEQHYETINLDDCYVNPPSSEYSGPTRTNHLNGTPYNDIYVKDGVTADDGHVSHE